MRSNSTTERFWAKVDTLGGPDACWGWLAYRMRNGYGQFQVGSQHVLAHRFVYELVVGPIPDGLTIDHLCRNRACVNPKHLEPVSNRINALRGFGGAHCSAKTHCPQGHVYDLFNTRYYRGHRYCRMCMRIATARWRIRVASEAR